MPILPLEVPLRYCTSCEAIVGAEEREQETQRRITDLLSRAGGYGFREFSLDTFPGDDDEGQRAKEVAREWLDRFLEGDRANLLLFGNAGTGKSGLAWSLIRITCEHGQEALFLPFEDYLFDLREAIRDKSYTVNRRGYTVPLLALDDLGRERPTDYAREQLSTLIQRRIDRALPTIVTSNYSPAELVLRIGHDDRRIGQRLVSRLTQDAVGFRFTGPDRRLG